MKFFFKFTLEKSVRFTGDILVLKDTEVFLTLNNSKLSYLILFPNETIYHCFGINYTDTYLRIEK